MAPQIAHFDFGDEALNPGDTASAQCTMNKGDYPAELIWLLNNKSVEGVEGIYTNRIGKRISSLSIESVQAFHAGEYVCVASNVAGIASYKAYLAVNGIFINLVPQHILHDQNIQNLLFFHYRVVSFNYSS